MAAWHNRLQELAAATRLGIPVTHLDRPAPLVQRQPGRAACSRARSRSGPSRSAWPRSATRRWSSEFGDIARQEYLAVGIRVALHPQIDLATEPRWARQVGTFGEDAELTATLGAAYIRGFQGDALGPEASPA